MSSHTGRVCPLLWVEPQRFTRLPGVALSHAMPVGCIDMVPGLRAAGCAVWSTGWGCIDRSVAPRVCLQWGVPCGAAGGSVAPRVWWWWWCCCCCWSVPCGARGGGVADGSVARGVWLWWCCWWWGVPCGAKGGGGGVAEGSVAPGLWWWWWVCALWGTFAHECCGEGSYAGWAYRFWNFFWNFFEFFWFLEFFLNFFGNFFHGHVKRM